MQVAAKTFSIDLGRVRTQTTNTFKCANTSPTAASSGADMNGKAAEIACVEILGRIKTAAAAILGHNAPHDMQIRDEVVWCDGRKTDLSWKELIQKAYLMKTQLSAYGHYAVPRLTFDKTKEKGSPFAYHVYGTALFEVTLDCLRGTYRFDSIKIVHDIGRSINPRIDEGQVVGAMIQGLGWMTMEELLYSPEGRPLIDSLSKYKVPDMRTLPPVLALDFLENADNPYAVLNSKAVGEPPLMYGIGAYFALQNALAAARPGKALPFAAPLTPKKTLAFLYDTAESV
jgi:xanthine dehydrogenase large subunit